MKKRIVIWLLLFSLIMGETALCCRAEEDEGNTDISQTIDGMRQQEQETQNAISDLEKQTKETKDAISALQGEKEKTQSNVSNLQNQSSQLQSTINGYSAKLDSLSAEITEAENAMAEVSSEIVELDKQLQQARDEEHKRYELLKKRIQSTYESGGNTGLARLLLESGSMQEFLTKYEYLTAIIEYDKKKIAEYKALQADIEAKSAVVHEKEEELDQYQTQLDEKHEELSGLTAEVKGKLSSTQNTLSSEKNKLADYDNKLAELDKKMKSLQAKTAAAQAELAKQIAERLALMKEDTSGAYSASESELVWLAATIQAEADGESYTGKLAVGSVIMNRVKSSAFPGDVVSVITQNMQFASYRSGKVELIMSVGPNSTCLRAAQEVLDGARVGDYLFFMTKYYADYYRISEYTMIGNHAFFYKWSTLPEPEPAVYDGEEQQEQPQEPEEPAQESEGEGQEQSEDSGDEGGDSEENDDEQPSEGGDEGGE
ncbi:cell wall hydrolase [Butyrivibrio sp. AE3009]|uniref:cell wall hydrolase n=1 Tax=Butyrivibrio sp. AE3009 TaxID=1280666 RepID=UPI0003B75F8A|nr:cell wall hydrolase [Butyrivibrio sp. AE3009]